MSRPDPRRSRRLIAGAALLLTAITAVATSTLGSSPARAAVTCGSETLAGTGTLADPLLVTTSAQLAAIGAASCLDKAYRLDADIALTGAWTPIGTNVAPFTGSLDGNDHAITGMAVTGVNYRGMFGAVSGSAISNLTLSGTVSATGQYVGMLSGAATNSLVTNVSVTATVSATYVGVAYAGGIIGSGFGVTVSDAMMSGAVIGSSSSEYVGGLIGYTSLTLDLRNSTNSADVEGNLKTGGLIGEVDGPTTITDSTNTGNVTGIDDYVGGLIGYVNDTTTITNSTNTGDITVDDADGYVGGLIGYVDDTTTITNSTNTGNVTVNDDYVGGLIGYVDDETTITNSTNSGNVDGDDEVGGIIGYVNDTTTITNSTNTGNVTGSDDYIGGLIGRVNDETTITGASNTGDVEGTGSDSDEVGGLIGDVEGGYDVDIVDTSVTGSVEGSANVGGLIGRVDHPAAEVVITRVTRSGATEGDGDVGGLIGEADGGITIQDTSVEGTVIATGDTAGGLIGYIENTSGPDIEIVGTSNRATVEAQTGGLAGGLIGHVDTDVNVGAPTMIIRRSESAGAVIAATTDAGGLIGQVVDPASVTIEYAKASSDVTGTNAVGGLIGSSDSGNLTITDSYATGDVTATAGSGGGALGSVTNAAVSNTYARGAVSATAVAGAFVASATSTTFTAVFFNAAGATTATSAAGTSVDLTNRSAFVGASWAITAGWSPFVSGTQVWGICADVNGGTPFLLWEYRYDACTTPPPPPSTASALPTLEILPEDDPDDEASGAVALAQLLDYAPTAFLIARDAPADALVAAANGARTGGPVLVTDRDTVPAATLAEIERLGAVRVVLVGGTSRISNDVESFLRDRYPSLSVDRLAGADRVATAADASTRHFVPGTSRVYLVAANAPADAVVAAAQGAPVLFTLYDSVPDVTMVEITRLDPDEIVIVGGPVRVAPTVLTALESAFPETSVSRLGGADRYETSALLMGSGATQVMLVDGGLTRVDSIAAAATAALTGTALLLTGKNCAPTPTHRLLEGRSIYTVGRVGTRACS